MTLIRFRPFPQTLDPSRDLTDIQTQMNRAKPALRQLNGGRVDSAGRHVRDQE